MILDGIHFNSLLFTELTAALRAHGFAGDKAGVPMQPAAELNIGGKGAGHAGEVCKDGLGDILGQMGVIIDETDSGGIDQINVAGDQFAEGGLGTGGDILSEQLWGVCHFF